METITEIHRVTLSFRWNQSFKLWF